MSREDATSDGRRPTDPVLGNNPVAYLISDAAGHFAVQFMRRDRRPVQGDAQRRAVGVGVNSSAINGYDGYFGRYRVGANSTVIQELEGALSPDDVGKVVTRRFCITDAELIIALETTATDGEPVTRTLRWRRVA